MIVWVKAESVNMPVDQRAEVVAVNKHRPEKWKVDVRLCGTGKTTTVETTDIVGVEIDSTFDLMFRVVGNRRRSYSGG